MAVVGPAHDRTALRNDALVAGGVAVLLLLGTAVTVPDDLWTELPHVAGSLRPAPAAAALLLAGSLPLTLRRVAPLAVLAVCVAASLGLQAIGASTPLPLGVLVAVYTVAVRYRPLVCVGAAGVYVALLAAGIASGVAPLTDDQVYDHLISLIATVMLGYGVALSRARARLAERRSVELAGEHDRRTRAALEQEQARIAREVHDIVAHDVSVIVAQAAAASRQLPPGDPSRTTLGYIETAGRDALDGMRRLLTLLRTDGGGTRSPQPRLDGLASLTEQVRLAGLPVDLVVRGDPRRLPGTVETNAYRIVQESLTNALKHAGPARATVVLDYGPEFLGVEVRDDGRGHPPSDQDGEAATPGGFGLVGMRQRAALLDGRVEAGPGEDGGFRVGAQLPVRGAGA